MFKLTTSFLAMIFIVALSNYLVQFPLNDWLTLAAFPYPISFLVTEITNRVHGPQKARKVVYAGFAVAVLLSFALATPKIALASGLAFVVSQLLDIYVFNQFRQSTWWYAPLFASLIASIVDTLLFFYIAFWGEAVPIFTWACGDFSVKVLIDFLMLTPFRFALRRATLTV